MIGSTANATSVAYYVGVSGADGGAAEEAQMARFAVSLNGQAVETLAAEDLRAAERLVAMAKGREWRALGWELDELAATPGAVKVVEDLAVTKAAATDPAAVLDVISTTIEAQAEGILEGGPGLSDEERRNASDLVRANELICRAAIILRRAYRAPEGR